MNEGGLERGKGQSADRHRLAHDLWWLISNFWARDDSRLPANTSLCWAFAQTLAPTDEQKRAAQIKIDRFLHMGWGGARVRWACGGSLQSPYSSRGRREPCQGEGAGGGCSKKTLGDVREERLRERCKRGR